MKKKIVYHEYLRSREKMAGVHKAVQEELSRMGEIELRNFQERFKLSNRKAGELLGVTEGQVENIRSGKSKQTPQMTQLIRLLSQKLHREIRKQARTEMRKAKEEPPLRTAEEFADFFSRSFPGIMPLPGKRQP